MALVSNRLFERFRRGRIGWIATIAGSIIFLWVLFRRMPIETLVKTVQGSNLAWIAAAITVVVAPIPIANAMRWRAMVLGLGLPVSLSEAIRLTYACYPLNVFAPGKAGDLIKALAVKGEGAGLRLTGSVIAERTVDLLVVAALAFVGGVLANLWQVIWSAAFVIAAILSVLLGIGFARTLLSRSDASAKWVGTLDSLHTLMRSPRLAANVLFWSVTSWLLNLLVFVFLLRAVGADVTPALALTAQPIAVFVGLVPISMSGLGTRELVLVALLGGFAPERSIVGASLLYTLATSWLLGIIGIPETWRVVRSIERRSVKNL